MISEKKSLCNGVVKMSLIFVYEVSKDSNAFLTSETVIRARRVCGELKQSGTSANFAEQRMYKILINSESAEFLL